MEIEKCKMKIDGVGIDTISGYRLDIDHSSMAITVEGIFGRPRLSLLHL